MTFRKWLLISMLLLIVGRVASQDTCPTLVQDALASLDTSCELTERNQACYGNVALTATAQGDVAEFKFDTVGDIEDLADLSTLDLEPMDTAAGTWGLAMMKVQADIPDSMPGQNVTFVLFGDVKIENTAHDDQTPMQAFYLTTGIGDSNCAEAPESGMMVQTPSGVKEVAFNVNGVDVEMGSTVIFQGRPGDDMRVKTIEGKALLSIDEEIIPVVQGSEYIAPLSDDFKIGEGNLLPYDEDEVNALPIRALDREITIANPLSEDQIKEVRERQQAGELLCSDDEDSYLPPCTKPLYDANGDLAQFDDNGNIVLKDNDGNPLFYDREGNPIKAVDDYYRYYSYWTDSKTLKDDFGNVIEIDEDGRVSILDPEGNRFEVTRDGVYTYVGVNGETYTFDGKTRKEELIIDENGRPILRDEDGAIFTSDPDERDPGIILPSTDEPRPQGPGRDSDTDGPRDPGIEPTPGRDLPRDPNSNPPVVEPTKPGNEGSERPSDPPPNGDQGREIPNDPPPSDNQGREAPPPDGDQGTGESREDTTVKDPQRELPGNTDPGRELPGQQAPSGPSSDDSKKDDGSGRELPPPPEDPKREG